MKRIWGHLLASTAVAMATACTVTACTHNDQTIFIRNVIAPPQVQVGTTVCTYTADPTLPLLGHGAVDAALTPIYVGHLLIGNQLIPQSSPNQVRTESNRVEIQGAVVRITDTSGKELKSYTRLTAGFIEPSTSGTPNFGTAEIEMLDAESVASALAEIPAGSTGTKRRISNVKIFGTTLGGTSVESNEFQFPIDVCSGCLVDFASGSEDAALRAQTGKANCAASLSGTGGTSTTIFQPCTLGQDQTVDCRLCQGFAACDPSTRSTSGGG